MSVYLFVTVSEFRSTIFTIVKSYNIRIGIESLSYELNCRSQMFLLYLGIDWRYYQIFFILKTQFQDIRFLYLFNEQS